MKQRMSQIIRYVCHRTVRIEKKGFNNLVRFSEPVVIKNNHPAFQCNTRFLRDESECCDIDMNITLDDIVRKAANMDMHLIKTDKYPHLSIEMILICFTGIAVAMGWIPI